MQTSVPCYGVRAPTGCARSVRCAAAQRSALCPRSPSAACRAVLREGPPGDLVPGLNWQRARDAAVGGAAPSGRRRGCSAASAAASQPMDSGDGGALPSSASGEAPLEAAAAVAGEAAAPAEKKKGGNFAKRSIVGVFLALAGFALAISGGFVYTLFISGVAWQAAREYFGFVTAENITLRMKPPPELVRTLTTVLSAGVCLTTFFSPALSGAALVLSAFTVLVSEVLLLEKPRLSQITTSIFGLFYCGYLCSFWLKLRLISAPALGCPWAASWPVMLGGVSTWTVGLLAVLTSVSCVVAADSLAYIVGKNFGKTPLIKVSPRKTVEGAVGGLAGSIIMALVAWKFAGWPGTALQATLLGSAIFVSSLFGDLIESVMKRDAGMKDSSDLIPGHGGLLDRFDSYMFTGAIVYFFTGYLPLFGI